MPPPRSHGSTARHAVRPRGRRPRSAPAPRRLLGLLGLLTTVSVALFWVALRLGFSSTVGPPGPAQAALDSLRMPLEAPVRGFVSRGLDPAIGHFGVDVALPVGTAVRAAAAGRVLLADSTRGGGWTLVLAHPRGLTTVYAHNSRLLVRAGTPVEAGQVIARSGNTGRLTSGPHLHLEAWRDRTPLDLSALVDAGEAVR